MKSKFSFKVFIPVIILIPMLFGMGTFIVVACSDTSLLSVGLPLMVLPVFVLFWLIFGELRTKVISADLEYDHIIISRYCGFAKPVTFYYADLDGFHTSILASTGGANEYLYLMKGGKKVAKFSDFYHKNYSEMKETLRGSLKDLGYMDFSYRQEVKEIFS
jgi:hypothetical protein